MKGKIKRLFDSERGVSPVIGVILMVAITVILAAVIGFFVLDLGSDTQSTPQASFSVTDDGNVIHDGGDTINGDNLALSGDFDTDATGSSDVTAGTDIGGVSGTGTVRVIWNGSGQSATLANIEYDV